jgi:hypothetical protein
MRRREEASSLEGEGERTITEPEVEGREIDVNR